MHETCTAVCPGAQLDLKRLAVPLQRRGRGRCTYGYRHYDSEARDPPQPPRMLMLTTHIAPCKWYGMDL